MSLLYRYRLFCQPLSSNPKRIRKVIFRNVRESPYQAYLRRFLKSRISITFSIVLAIGWKVKSENRKCFDECRLNVAVDDLVCDFLVGHVVCLSCCCLLYVSII